MAREREAKGRWLKGWGPCWVPRVFGRESHSAVLAGAPPLPPPVQSLSPSLQSLRVEGPEKEASPRPHEKGGGSRDFPEPRRPNQTAHGEQGLEAPGVPREAFYFVRTSPYP